jgi:hypothetical protein
LPSHEEVGLKDDRLSRVLEVHTRGSVVGDHFFDDLGKIAFEWPCRGEPEDNVLNWLGQQARVTDPAPSLQIANTERNIERVVQDAFTRMLAELFTKCSEFFRIDRRNAPHAHQSPSAKPAKASYQRTCTLVSPGESGIGRVDLAHPLHRASVVRMVLHREL